MAEYDYLIVGAGLFGAVFAHEAVKAGKRPLCSPQISSECSPATQSDSAGTWRSSA